MLKMSIISIGIRIEAGKILVEGEAVLKELSSAQVSPRKQWALARCRIIFSDA